VLLAAAAGVCCVTQDDADVEGWEQEVHRYDICKWFSFIGSAGATVETVVIVTSQPSPC
jgi:hypothetical protein